MRKHFLFLPNLLTYWRIVSVALVAICFFLQDIHSFSMKAHWFAASIFVIACITDFFDGYLARIWHQTSSLGQMLDPIADKLLVATSLILLTACGTITGISLVAAIIILCREILVSGMREYLASLKVLVPVSSLAKWKTASQMTSLTLLLLGPAGDQIFPYTTQLGLTLLLVSAILTLQTGYVYLKQSLTHMY